MSKSEPKLFTTRQIADMLGLGTERAAMQRVINVIAEFEISHVKSKGTVKCGKSKRFKPSYRQFDIDAVNEVRRRLLEKAAGRQKKGRPAIGIAASDANKGMHDEEGTEFLKAVDKFKTETRCQIIKVSDYLAIAKSLGYRKQMSNV
ncbi:MAG: hypothetical protein FVQ79_11820 [Planctomycetes bacterium]|nr:hypothetical protein [Planctomycetota bacterium]